MLGTSQQIAAASKYNLGMKTLSGMGNGQACLKERESHERTRAAHDDDVDQLIAEHGGDVQAAIATLLSERSFLIKELEYASLAMGFGYARGWKPKLIRSRH